MRMLRDGRRRATAAHLFLFLLATGVSAKGIGVAAVPPTPTPTPTPVRQHAAEGGAITEPLSPRTADGSARGSGGGGMIRPTPTPLGASAPLTAPGPILYVHDGSRWLGTVNVTNGDVAIIGRTSEVLTDIAFSPSGELFGVSFSSLYRVDVATAQLSLVGSLGVIDQVNALVFGADGTLYAAGGQGVLYTVNPVSGAASAVGPIGRESAGDLAFDATGTLYMASTSDELVRVDRVTGAGTIVGPLGFSAVFGLAFGDDGIMYGIAGTQVFSINLATGSGTPVSNFGGRGLGTANGSSFFREAVPVCTPPPCPGGTLQCPGACPGGCGVACATHTPTPTARPGCALDPASPWCDEFSGPGYDATRWYPRIVGSGVGARQIGDRLEVELTAGAAAESLGSLGALFESRCLLAGDFDVEVRYQLLDWPQNNGARVGILAVDPDAASGVTPPGTIQMARRGPTTDRPAESYASWSSLEPPETYVATSDTSGTLRLVRSGDRLTAYYRSGATWQQLGPDRRAPADALRIRIGAWSNATDFVRQRVRVALDDFIVRAGRLLCDAPPCVCTSTWFADEFDGSALDATKWSLAANSFPAPAVVVDGGSVQVGRPGIAAATFPYIVSQGAIFPPSGDFDLEVALRFTSLEPRGTGLQIQGPNGEFLLQIWQASTLGGVRTIIGSELRIITPALAPHVFRIEFRGDTGTIYANGAPLVSGFLRARPASLWFGNPSDQGTNAPWTTFRLDSLRVSGGCDCPPVLRDDFATGIDPGRWITRTFGIGPTTTPQGGRAEVSIPSSSDASPPVVNIGSTIELAGCVVRGDFDVRIEYALPEWPLRSGVRLALRASPHVLRRSNAIFGGAAFLVERAGAGLGGSRVRQQLALRPEAPQLPTDHYAARSFSTGLTGYEPTSDRVGALRIGRVGDEMRGFYRSGDRWVETGRLAPAGGGVAISLLVDTYEDEFSSQTVRVAFDNFEVVRGELDCGSTQPRVPAPCSDPGRDVVEPICMDSTWRASDSPIRVLSSIGVGGSCPAGAAPTLTIEPGTTVCFADDTALNVLNGTLIARGTEAAPIFFTSAREPATPGSWDGVRFHDGAQDATFDANGAYLGGSILEHAVIEYAKDTDNRGVLSAYRSKPSIRNVVLVDNAASTAVIGLDPGANESVRLRSVYALSNEGRTGANGDGLRLSTGTADVVGLAAFENSGNGVRTFSNTELRLVSSAISRNGSVGVFPSGTFNLASTALTANGDDGMRARDLATGSIIDAAVFSNGASGIELGPSGGAASSTILRSTIFGNGAFGIETTRSNASLTLQNSCLVANGAGTTDARGRALRISGQATIESNSIVAHRDTAVWFFGAQQPSSAMARNRIEGNHLPGLDYAAPAGAATLQAPDNWWGGTDLVEVGRQVVDCNDTVSPPRPCVNILPLATGPPEGAPSSGACARCLAEVPTDHWRGEYWNNTALAGLPQLVRDDGSGFLDFNWGVGSPDLICGIGNEYFSARWTRSLSVPASATYRFTVATDDGVRVYLDNNLVLDRWVARPETRETVDLLLSAGEHQLRLEYFDATSFAIAKVAWEIVAPPTPTPTVTWTPSRTTTATSSPTPTASGTRTPTISATRTLTATPTATATAVATCTPLRCPTGQVAQCQGAACVGGCGNVCATPTPATTPARPCAQALTDLAIVIDSSSSIDTTDFALEKEGIARAVEDASKLPQDGSVCVAVVRFSSAADIVVPATCIDDRADADRLAGLIRAIPRVSGPTGIDLGIRAAADHLARAARPGARQVVLVGTDGLPNVSANCDLRVRGRVPACPPAPACAALDETLQHALTVGVDEVSFITIEDPGQELIQQDFTNFFGCRAVPQPNSPGPPPQPGFVITVPRQFDEFARQVTATLPSLSCSTRIDLTDGVGQPGGRSTIRAELSNDPGRDVVAAGLDMFFDPRAATADCVDCRIHPAIGPGTAADKSLSCTVENVSAERRRLRLAVLASGNVNRIPDGELFSCAFSVGTSATPGTRIPVQNLPVASDPSGVDLTVIGRDGSIAVGSCPGDCDGNRTVTLGEVVRVVRAFLGLAAPSECASADTNADGRVTIADVIRAIGAFLAGCA